MRVPGFRGEATGEAVHDELAEKRESRMRKYELSGKRKRQREGEYKLWSCEKSRRNWFMLGFRVLGGLEKARSIY